MGILYSDIHWGTEFIHGNMPVGVTIMGDLIIHVAIVQKLPDNLVVTGILNIDFSGITLLPDGLRCGILESRNSELAALPNNLRVDRRADVVCCNIASIGHGVSIGGDLFISQNPLSTIPDDIYVGGLIFATNTDVTTKSVPARYASRALTGD